MVRVIAFKAIQGRRYGAFMPSMEALVSMHTQNKVPGSRAVNPIAVEQYNNNSAQKNESKGAISEVDLFKVAQKPSMARGFGNLAIRNMPRSRGVSRRGGRSGVRVSPEMEDLHPISPMALAPPSSSSSEQEYLVPQSTYQTFRLRFPSRLVRPDVVVNFTVYILEEVPDEPASSSPATASVQDSHILLGDMNGLVYRAHRSKEFQAAAVRGQHAPAREDSGYDVSEQEVLPPTNLVRARGGTHDQAQAE